MLEVIAPMPIKETMGVKNGDEISIRVHISTDNNYSKIKN
jgi:CTP-dependent riboflavin kinase